MATIVPSVTWCWRPISRCPECGSCELDLDHDLEFYECRRCGSSGGGAAFWEIERDGALPVSRVCWGCGDPLLEDDYCEPCKVSIQIIQRLQEDGTCVLWIMPWMHAEKAGVHR